MNVATVKPRPFGDSLVGCVAQWKNVGYSLAYFPVLRLTCSWRVTTHVDKPSAVGRPTRPTQPFILSGSINWVVSWHLLWAESPQEQALRAREDAPSPYPEPARGPEKPVSPELVEAAHQRGKAYRRRAAARRSKSAPRPEEPEKCGSDYSQADKTGAVKLSPSTSYGECSDAAPKGAERSNVKEASWDDTERSSQEGGAPLVQDQSWNRRRTSIYLRHVVSGAPNQWKSNTSHESCELRILLAPSTSAPA